MADPDRDWADEFVDQIFEEIALSRHLLATRLRGLYAKAQADAIVGAMKQVEAAFDKAAPANKVTPLTIVRKEQDAE